MNLLSCWRFLKGYFHEPNVVGAIFPSSPALASALCAPLREHNQPARVLEVGAGTGAITRHLGTILGERDELDVCEIRADFADIIRREVLSRDAFVPAVREGRVRLLQTAAQNIEEPGRYDFVISGLPFTSFALRDVDEVFRVVRKNLKSGGVFSYFEYIAMRRTSRWLSMGRRHGRVKDVSGFLSENIRSFQFRKRAVLANFPPAVARYLRFESGSGHTPLKGR